MDGTETNASPTRHSDATTHSQAGPPSNLRYGIMHSQTARPLLDHSTKTLVPFSPASEDADVSTRGSSEHAEVREGEAGPAGVVPTPRTLSQAGFTAYNIAGRILAVAW